MKSLILHIALASGILLVTSICIYNNPGLVGGIAKAFTVYDC